MSRARVLARGGGAAATAIAIALALAGCGQQQFDDARGWLAGQPGVASVDGSGFFSGFQYTGTLEVELEDGLDEAEVDALAHETGRYLREEAGSGVQVEVVEAGGTVILEVARTREDTDRALAGWRQLLADDRVLAGRSSGEGSEAEVELSVAVDAFLDHRAAGAGLGIGALEVRGTPPGAEAGAGPATTLGLGEDSSCLDEGEVVALLREIVGDPRLERSRIEPCEHWTLATGGEGPVVDLAERLDAGLRGAGLAATGEVEAGDGGPERRVISVGGASSPPFAAARVLEAAGAGYDLTDPESWQLRGDGDFADLAAAVAEVPASALPLQVQLWGGRGWVSGPSGRIVGLAAEGDRVAASVPELRELRLDPGTLRVSFSSREIDGAAVAAGLDRARAWSGREVSVVFSSGTVIIRDGVIVPGELREGGRDEAAALDFVSAWRAAHPE